MLHILGLHLRGIHIELIHLHACRQKCGVPCTQGDLGIFDICVVFGDGKGVFHHFFHLHLNALHTAGHGGIPAGAGLYVCAFFLQTFDQGLKLALKLGDILKEQVVVVGVHIAAGELFDLQLHGRQQRHVLLYRVDHSGPLSLLDSHGQGMLALFQIEKVGFSRLICDLHRSKGGVVGEFVGEHLGKRHLPVDGDLAVYGQTVGKVGQRPQTQLVKTAFGHADSPANRLRADTPAASAVGV